MSLLYKSNNAAESVNNVISMFNGAKRLNYCGRNGYEAIVHGAMTSCNQALPFRRVFQHVKEVSPNVVTTNVEQKILRQRECVRLKGTLKKRLDFSTITQTER